MKDSPNSSGSGFLGSRLRVSRNFRIKSFPGNHYPKGFQKLSAAALMPFLCYQDDIDNALQVQRCS